jgi:hypothetical protein
MDARRVCGFVAVTVKTDDDNITTTKKGCFFVVFVIVVVVFVVDKIVELDLMLRVDVDIDVGTRCFTLRRAEKS